MIVEVETKLELNLPPGFKFYPTDEELVLHYLCRKVQHKELPVPIIADIDLYKFDPWQLPEKALFGEKEWYFFTPRDRKYPNGSRPNRAAGSGYWKATGADKHIRPPSISGRHYLGIKKALVFYAGKAPHGHKTNWIMHEYRLVRSDAPAAPHKEPRTLRLDDWVLCRIYNKKNSREKIVHQQSTDQEDSAVTTGDEELITGNLGSDSKSGCYQIVDQEQEPDFFNGLTDLAPILRTSLISNGTGEDMNEAAAAAADPLFGFQQEGELDDYHLPGVPSLSDFAKEWLSAYQNQMLTF